MGIVVIGAVFVDIKGFPEDVYVRRAAMRDGLNTYTEA